MVRILYRKGHGKNKMTTDYQWFLFFGGLIGGHNCCKKTSLHSGVFYIALNRIRHRPLKSPDYQGFLL